MKLSPRSEALAYRIWAHCGPLGWNTTVTAVADALEAPIGRVRIVMQYKGWLNRLRSDVALTEYGWTKTAFTPAHLSLGEAFDLTAVA